MGEDGGLFLFDFFRSVERTCIHLAESIERAKSDIPSHKRDDTDEEPVCILHKVKTREKCSSHSYTDKSIDDSSIAFHRIEVKVRVYYRFIRKKIVFIV